MAQRGGGVTLPAINSRSYDIVEQDFSAIDVGSPQKRTLYEETRINRAGTSDRDRGQSRMSPRLNSLENKVSIALAQQNEVLNQQRHMNDALHQQQEITRNLIDRASQNRDDFIENLRGLHDNRLQENTRQLLGNHLKFITAIVQRLNSDITSLEEQLKVRDYAVMGTNSAVGKLEVHNVTMLQDLRSRIARCDAAIMRHSADMRNASNDMALVARDQHGLKDHLSEKIHRLEAEMLSITAELERMAGQQHAELMHMKKDSHREFELLDQKSAHTIAEISDTVSSYKDLLNSQQKQSETRLFSLLHRATDEWNNVMTRMDSKLGEHNYNFNDRLNKLETAVNADRAVLSELQSNIESVVIARVDAYSRQQLEEISRAKQEFREGFTSVHDSIANAKTVLEGKLKLVEDRLRKEISQVRKIAMLTRDEEEIVFQKVK